MTKRTKGKSDTIGQSLPKHLYLSLLKVGVEDFFGGNILQPSEKSSTFSKTFSQSDSGI